MHFKNYELTPTQNPLTSHCRNTTHPRFDLWIIIFPVIYRHDFYLLYVGKAYTLANQNQPLNAI